MTTRRQVLSATLMGGIGAAAVLPACTRSDTIAQLSLSQKQDLLSAFAVNLEMWWTDIPFEQRFDAAAKAGFTQVEFWFVTAWKRDPKALADLARNAGVSVSQTVCRAPALADRGQHEQFLSAAAAAIEEAQILGAPVVTVTGHKHVSGVTRGASLVAYADALERSEGLWREAKVIGAVEPFNPYDHPGHFINGYADAFEICLNIDSPYIKMNWDLFHMQRAEGNVIDNMARGASQIGYMQLADSPDRHQPSTGEMNYAAIIKAARSLGYQGPIGLECVPKDKDNARAARDVLNLAQAVKPD